MTSYRLRAYIYLLIVAVIWGAAGPVIKFTLGGIDPFPFLSYRFAVAAIFSTIFFLVKGTKIPKPRKSLPFVILYGLLAVPIALGMLFVGLDKSTVLDLTLIGVIGPLIVTAGGAIFFRDRITHREKIGILIVLAGALINAFSPLFTGNIEARVTGNIFLLTFLLADSGSILVAKSALRHKIKSAVLTNTAFILGAITIIPLTAILYGPNNLIKAVTELPFKYHLGVWYMALASGSLAYFLYVRAVRSIEVSEATLFNYLQPAISVPLALFWLGEKLTPTFVIGAALIATGLIIGEYKKARRAKVTRAQNN